MTARRRARFLTVLKKSGNVSRAAKAAGISRSAAYNKRQREPAFARAWDEAMAFALDQLEEALLSRAREGVAKPVHFQGKEVGAVRTYSDQLAMFLLKARRPEVFGDADTGERSKAGINHARHQIERKLARLAASQGSPEISD